MDAMAGAVAIRKPAEVKKMEKAPILSIRRKRARRRAGEGEADSTISLLTALAIRFEALTEVRAMTAMAADEALEVDILASNSGSGCGWKACIGKERM